jgi:hypothetical protein
MVKKQPKSVMSHPNVKKYIFDVKNLLFIECNSIFAA